MSEQKPTITASSVLADLKNGLTREDIGNKYGISKADVKRMFQDPVLKGKKTIKPKEPGFVFINDVTETDEAKTPDPTPDPIGEEATQPEPEPVDESDSMFDEN